VDVVNVVKVGELFSSLRSIGGGSKLGGALSSQRRSNSTGWGSDSSSWGSNGGGASVEGVLGGDGIVELRETELAIVVLVSTTEESKDFLFSSSGTVFLEESVDGVNVNRAESVNVNSLEEGKGIEVVTVSEVLSEDFSLVGKVDFLFEDTSKAVFNFVAENFISGNKVGFSLSGNLTEDAVSLGEEDVKELSVGESVVSLSVLFLEDESEFFFSDENLVFSKEGLEVSSEDMTKGVTVDSLEGSVWFESRLFSEDLSEDFDLLFTISDSLEEISELELGLDAWH